MYFSYSAFQRLLQICVFFNFLLNVEGIKSSKRKLKLMQYFKDKTGSTGVLFLQETDFDCKVEQKQKEDFKGSFFFSHGKSNSCGVLIAFFGTGTFIVKKQQTDLILDVSINNSEYILIHLYNANIENQQFDVLSSLFELFKEFDISLIKQPVTTGDFNLFVTSKLKAQGENHTS